MITGILLACLGEGGELSLVTCWWSGVNTAGWSWSSLLKRVLSTEAIGSIQFGIFTKGLVEGGWGDTDLEKGR